MQKLSLIPLMLIVTIGAVWASTIIFPNTTELPRTPQSAGSIWWVLYDWFDTDGTARITEKLGGISASGYLGHHDCSLEPINRVWVGIDSGGRAICGSKTVQLASIGKFTDIVGNIQVKKNGSTLWTPANTSDLLTEGDIIQTDSSSTGTIAFIADESILRLDTSTTVELSIGNLSGQSVAQAILTDGRLWGRILTSTGVNLGGWGTVAWVRGTSVSVARSSTGYYTISVIDSIRSTDAANIVGWWGVYTLDPGNQIGYTPPSGDIVNTVTNLITQDTIGKTTLLTSSAWIRDNTRKDIDYLYANSGAGNNTRVVAEYNATVPPATDTNTLIALCENNHTYWPSLIPLSGDKCRESSLYAFANYDTLSTNIGSIEVARPLVLKNNIISATGAGIFYNGWYVINSAYQYILYEFLDYSVLEWKTITIELASTIWTNLPTWWTKAYIADFGSEKWFLVNVGGKCLTTTVTSPTLCKTIGTINSVVYWNWWINIPVTLSTIPTKVVIGNVWTPMNASSNLKLPIWTTIKNIRIQ